MHKVTLSERAIAAIDTYSRKYREYFEELYADSGIWAEDQIIDQYKQESLQRRQEILFLLAEKLSKDTILGRTAENTAVFSWRSKILLVSWQESGDTRTITDLSIR